MTEYPIGTQYEHRNRLCVVVDVLKTYNSKNELVKVRYVSTHKFMEQNIADHDVVAVTIARGLKPTLSAGIEINKHGDRLKDEN